MEKPKIMRRKSVILLAIALSVGVISSSLHAAKKEVTPDPNGSQILVATQTK